MPSIDNDKKEKTGEDDRSDIFSSLEEEESSLMEDWTSLQVEVFNLLDYKTKPDKIEIAEMFRRLTRKWSGTPYWEIVKLCVKFLDWQEYGNDIAYTLLGWVQETMHMVDGLDKLWEDGEIRARCVSLRNFS